MNTFKIAKDPNTRLRDEAFVVNLPSRDLRNILREADPETDLDYRKFGARVISYEHFPPWLEQLVTVGAGACENRSELTLGRRSLLILQISFKVCWTGCSGFGGFQ